MRRCITARTPPRSAPSISNRSSAAAGSSTRSARAARDEGASASTPPPSFRRGCWCGPALKAPTEWSPAFSAFAPDTIAWLASLGVKLVGIDSQSVDPADSKTLDSHHATAPHDLRVLENLVLDEVDAGRLRIDRAAAEAYRGVRLAGTRRVCDAAMITTRRLPAARRRRSARRHCAISSRWTRSIATASSISTATLWACCRSTPPIAPDAGDRKGVGRGLIRSWNTAGWIDLSQRIGDKIAHARRRRRRRTDRRRLDLDQHVQGADGGDRRFAKHPGRSADRLGARPISPPTFTLRKRSRAIAAWSWCSSISARSRRSSTIGSRS